MNTLKSWHVQAAEDNNLPFIHNLVSLNRNILLRDLLHLLIVSHIVAQHECSLHCSPTQMDSMDVRRIILDEMDTRLHKEPRFYFFYVIFIQQQEGLGVYCFVNVCLH